MILPSIPSIQNPPVEILEVLSDSGGNNRGLSDKTQGSMQHYVNLLAESASSGVVIFVDSIGVC